MSETVRFKLLEGCIKNRKGFVNIKIFKKIPGLNPTGDFNDAIGKNLPFSAACITSGSGSAHVRFGSPGAGFPGRGGRVALP